jgi:hypothetical protein
MNDNYEDDQFSDILTNMCGAIVKTIGLIPQEHREARLLACAYVLDHINDAVERMVNGGNATETKLRVTVALGPFSLASPQASFVPCACSASLSERHSKQYMTKV